MESSIESRIRLCKLCISILEQVDDSDSRKADALQHYRDQLALLESKLPNPPPVVIKLKTAKIFPSAGNLKE